MNVIEEPIVPLSITGTIVGVIIVLIGISFAAIVFWKRKKLPGFQKLCQKGSAQNLGSPMQNPSTNEDIEQQNVEGAIDLDTISKPKETEKTKN